MKKQVQKLSSVIALITLLCCFNSNNIFAQETKLMQQPALSDTQIAFVYANDLWVANRDGSNPKRLTIDEGIESSPIFSPDGSMIAFNAQYDGNSDVFIVPAKGGVPKRLTWHPYNDIVRDFTPDGKNVLFASQRNSHTNRYFQLYTVSIKGGTSKQLEIPNAFWASISRIWVYDTNNHKVVEIPKPQGGSNDTQPQWIGEEIFFRSDRDGEFNLFSYNTNTKAITKHTDYKDFPVVNAKTHKNFVIYEHAGTLHIYDTTSKTDKKLRLHIATDLLELRERYVSGERYARFANLSPSGTRIVLDFRGEIVTIPAIKGDQKNITRTTGVHEKFPAWSPDGKSIAYFSDASGEYTMHIYNNTNGSVKNINLKGTGFYANIHWSPDSKKVSYVDNGRNLYVTTISSQKTIKIAQDDQFFPGDIRDLFSDWSFDSNWIAYTKIIDTNFEKAYLYSLSQNKSYELTDGLANVTQPTFDPSGKYVYLTASTDAGPLVNWFDQSNIDKRLTMSLYAITLQKEIVSPLKKDNDEEKGSAAEKDSEDKEAKSKKGSGSSEKLLKIDWDGIKNRMLALPISAGVYGNLSSVKEVLLMKKNPKNFYH